MYKAVIFDLDGTLLDTSRDICKVLNHTLQTFGCPPVTLERCKEIVGDGAKKLVERALPENFGPVGEAYDYYRAKFAACDNALTRLYDGEEDFLRGIKARAVKTAILTNKPDDATQKVYSSFLCQFGFNIVLGNTARFALKPDPAAVNYIAEELGVEKADCLFVGDGETDIATARNAGIDCASVLWGFRTRERLAAAGGKLFVANFTQLFSVVSNG